MIYILKRWESSDTAQAVMCLRGIGRDEKVSKVFTPSISAESNLLSAVSLYQCSYIGGSILNCLLLLPEEITDILYSFDFPF